MPCPGMKSTLLSRSAYPSCPLARRPSTTCSLVMPAGIWPPMTPAKMRSVARPRILGPIELSATLTTAKTSTTATLTRCGRRRPSRRLADGPKSSDFSAGWPIVMCGGPPRRAGPRRASAAFSSVGLDSLGHQAATSALRWDSTISW